MRTLTVMIAVAVLATSFANVASAQLRRRTYSQSYPARQQQQFNQYQPPQGPAGQPWTASRYAPERASGPMQGGSYTDQQLADWLLVDNRGEIQLARLAQDRALCDDVKDFAKQLIDDHAQMVENLQRFAGAGRRMQQAFPQGGQQFGQPGAPQFGQSGDQQAGYRGEAREMPPGQQRMQPAGPSAGGLNFVRLKQQLGQQCVSSAQRELEQKEGEEFDKCYIGMQIAKHMQMLDTLKVFSRYASPQLDQVIEEAEQTTQDHLDRAEDLIKQHEGKGDTTSTTSSDHSSSRTRDRDND